MTWTAVFIACVLAVMIAVSVIHFTAPDPQACFRRGGTSYNIATRECHYR